MNTLWIKIFSVCFLLANFATGQRTYQQRFPAACQDAFDFYSEFEQEFNVAAARTKNEPDFLFGIVAPELSQYNQINDYWELYALKALYAQNGPGYADFSVGCFKMKPSFIENLEDFVASNETLKNKYVDILFDDPEIKAARVTRVERLETIEWQIRYLGVFCDVMNLKFKNKTYVSNEAKLAFYATAYNSGFHKSEGEIQSMYNKKLFPAKTKEPFNYAEIAKWFYNEIKG